MSEIDRQRIAAVKHLEERGYIFGPNGRTAPFLPPPFATPEADQLHALLMKRADALAGCSENFEAGAELAAIADALQTYEAIRWPAGRAGSGKG
jgi:hypothetical protein